MGNNLVTSEVSSNVAPIMTIFTKKIVSYSFKMFELRF